MNNLKGNLSTIVKFFVMTIAPYLGVEAVADQLTGLIIAIIGFILAYIDAYYPNTFSALNNDKDGENDSAA